MKLLFVLCLAVFGFFTASAQEERYVKPVDEARKDASFHAFRTKLVEATRKRDAKYILSIVDRDIKLSFGDLRGVEDFKKTWKIDSPQSEFWQEFLPVITGGGTFYREEGNKNKQFFAPYTYTSFPEDLDAFDYSVIFGSNVNLRSKPAANAPVAARLSYNIVKVDYENSVKDKNKKDTYSWLKIESLGGKKGFVKAEYVRGPIDYRAGFEKKNGKWMMTFFIAGD